MIELTCEHCGKTVSVADQQAGQESRCPACGQMLSIPPGGQAPAPLPPIPLPVAAVRVAPPLPLAAAPAAPAGPVVSSSLATAALLIGIVVLVLLVGLTVWRIVRFARTDEFGLGPLVFVEGLVRFAGCVAGVVLGIVAAVKIRNSRGRLTGSGKAVTGIVLCGVTLVLSGVGFLLAIAMPAVAGMKDKASAVRAQANIRNLCEAAFLYTTEQRGRFPAADTFPQTLAPYAAGDMDEFLSDPADPSAGRAFAMNAHLSGVRMDAVREPHATVLFFECEFGSPPAGTRRHLPATPRYRGGYIVCFVDGHVEQVPPEEVDDLIWDPRSP